MPATEREASRDRESVLRSQHSWSESGRASVPMWDSSDPDRAPPPLPLNPSHSPATKANTSAGIAAAAKLIVERARDNAPISAYTKNGDGTPGASPERSLIKGAAHRRMQSFQTGNVKDLRNYLDNRSPERPASSSDFRAPLRKDSGEELSPFNNSTPTPTPRDPLKDTPNLRSSARALPRPLLGENTPPSATMLALQTMQVPELPLSDVTNGPSTPSPTRQPTGFDVQTQLQNLTTIANNLQREMTQLSRRSKDNATDLVGLKEATSQRDEDIRKSLRELSSNVGNVQGLLGPPGSLSRSTGALGGLFDSKIFNSPPSATKTYTIPRATSANSFLDEPHIGSPSPFSVEGVASVAMLEKIIREMVTKEGQERLQTSLSELLEKSRKENSDAAKRVEELSQFIKETSESRALVPVSKDGPPFLEINFDPPGVNAKTRENGGNEARMISSSDELMKMLHRIKESVTHSGGTVSEVKGLVRDLRGEVLGMGRQLGQKLDLVGASGTQMPSDRSLPSGQNTESAEEIQRIVVEGFAELKDHLSNVMRQRAHDDDDTFKQLATRSVPDEDGIFAVVKHALAEHGTGIVKREQDKDIGCELDREGVLEAVKEGLKDFEPNIELQQFGLERDEILAVLKEGLQDYQNTRPEPVTTVIDKGEIYEVMQEALKDFEAPMPREHMSQLKDDLLENFRQMLEEYKLAASDPTTNDEAMRLALAETIREGLVNHSAALPRDNAISREDVFDAVKAGLDSAPTSSGEHVTDQLRELMDVIRDDLRQHSAANGRDTEQVLVAVKDGLESLRVDRGIEDASPPGLSSEALSSIRAEFERLHLAINERDASHDMNEQRVHHTAEIIMAVREAMDELKERDSIARSVDGDGVSNGTLESLKQELELLKTALLHANAQDKGEISETIQDSMGALHARLNGSELGGLPGGSAEEIIAELRAEFSHLKEALQTIVVDGDREAIIGSVRQTIEDLRTNLAADQNDVAAETIGTIKEELDHFRETAGSGTVGTGITVEMLEAIRGEFDSLRNTIASTTARGGSNEEVLEAMRLGLDDLRSHVDKRFDNPDHATSQHDDILDAINDGLETLRADVVKTLDKPLDMTVNYEILETLKDGLAELRVELEKLKTGASPASLKDGEVVLADETAVGTARDISSDADNADSIGAESAVAGVERMELLMAQLQIKIEAMDAGVQEIAAKSTQPSQGAVVRDDIVGLEAILKDLQVNVAALTIDHELRDGLAKKEDTDAIETLLRNTKSHLEDVALPGLEDAVTKEHLDSVEATVRITNESIDGIVEKLESSMATKSDVAVIEVLAQDLKSSLDDMMETSRTRDANQPDLMTKADLDVLGVICTEIKTKVNEMVLPDVNSLPSRSDVEQLQGLINDFRESHDKMRESYESDISVTAKAFDDRKQEFQDTIHEINDVKSNLAEIKDEILDKIFAGESGIVALGETLKILEAKAEDETLGSEIKDLAEKLSSEFERAHASLDDLRCDQKQAADSSLEKQAEHRSALETLINEKLETYFDGLMSKYDEAREAAELKTRDLEAQAASQEELMNSTKAMADELKISIDTLGTTLTAFCATFPDTMEKLAEESKTVFTRVDDTYNKLDETQEGLRAEHFATREGLTKVMAAIDVIQSDATEHNPRFMVALQEVQALIGQHYEHSMKASDTAAEHAKAVKDLQEQVRNLGGQSDALRADGDDSSEIGSNSSLHQKLDRLMDTARDGNESDQLERLDQIHEQVMATAAEVSAFVSQQTKQIAESHDGKAREVEELALLLERRQAQKDNLETDIGVLENEKSSMQKAIKALQAEKETLAAQKTRLTADVSSLETAMHIRRDELHEMDRKAEALERRILEGVMNQSRLLLLTKTTKSPVKKRPQGRDLRIPSNASVDSSHTVTSSVPPLKASHALAMRSRPFATANRATGLGASANTPERRIMSLNQIHHNVQPGTASSTFSPAPSSLAAGAAGPKSFKRSHSVRAPFLPKPSWAVPRRDDKENDALSEDSAEDEAATTSRPTSRDSRSGASGTEASHGRSRFSAVSYDTGSYLTGSDLDRRSSFGSSAHGVLGLNSDAVDAETGDYGAREDDDDDEEEDEEAERDRTAVPAQKLLAYPPSDSGLGTDLPTAALSSVQGGEYFRR